MTKCLELGKFACEWRHQYRTVATSWVIALPSIFRLWLICAVFFCLSENEKHKSCVF